MLKTSSDFFFAILLADLSTKLEGQCNHCWYVMKLDGNRYFICTYVYLFYTLTNINYTYILHVGYICKKFQMMDLKNQYVSVGRSLWMLLFKETCYITVWPCVKLIEQLCTTKNLGLQWYKNKRFIKENTIIDLLARKHIQKSKSNAFIVITWLYNRSQKSIATKKKMEPDLKIIERQYWINEPQ